MLRKQQWYLLGKKIFFIAALFSLSLLGQAAEAAQSDGDLQRVVINVAIDNPDYFWKYPFQGRSLDAIRVSGVGRTINITPQTEGAKMELDVPRGYKFRIYFEFQNSAATTKYVYLTKRISDSDKTLDVVLKAPESQPVIIVTPDWEQQKQ